MNRQPRALRLGSGALTFDRVRVMGIVNVTPDSFYDGGQYEHVDAAIERGLQLVREGADILDVGGEKAGPGEPVSPQQESGRVVPVIEALHHHTSVPLSVDTFKPEVARAAVRAGADIVNSIGGFGDPAMQRVAAEGGAAVVIMHIRGQPRVACPSPRYTDVLEDVRAFLLQRAAECERVGIPPDQIMVDPGPGFGKRTEHDLVLMKSLAQLAELPYPLVLAVSRKRFIGEISGGEPQERLEASLALAAWGIMHGVALIRTHDVAETRRACAMTEAVLDPAWTEPERE